LLSDHGYHAHGLPELRERIAARYESRGLPTDPEQIVETHGALHAFALVLRILTSPGDRVLVEHPTYPNAIDSIRAVHAQPVPVPMTANGWDLDGIEAVLRQSCPKIGYHMVDFHNPTGLQMDAADREHLASLYRRTRTMAVIDETLLELDLEGGPLMPTVASFAEDWTITIGSASKTFWGGLRLGWLRLPKHLVHRFVIGRSALDLGSPVFEQLVLAELLVDPEPGLIRQRAMFRGRRDALLDAAAEHLPSWQVRVPRGGLSLWFDLGAPIGSRLAITAEDLDVHVTPGARFSAQGGLENRLRLPFVQPEDILAEAVRRLGQAASALSPARELRSTSVA
jgi:DNA-binding transcriptional MocR family regulator